MLLQCYSQFLDGNKYERTVPQKASQTLRVCMQTVVSHLFSLCLKTVFLILSTREKDDRNEKSIARYTKAMLLE